MQTGISQTYTIGVVGSGAMGAGIAQIAAMAGHHVKLYDTRPDAIHTAIANIRKVFSTLVEKKRMTAAEAEHAGARLIAAPTIQALNDAHLVVEAIAENLEIKRQLFVELEQVVTHTCILASNTSSISITALGAALRHPERFVGMHFFNPVPLMQLVEVISGLATSSATAEITYATAKAWGKSPVYAKSTPGFIVNRVARPYYGEALRLLNEQAADVATIDAILRESGGFRMGAFELMDLIGHDVNFAVTKSVFQSYYNDPRFTPSLLQQELVDAGYLGRKSGRGFYLYQTEMPLAQTEAPQATNALILSSHTHHLCATLTKRLSDSGITMIDTPDKGDDQPIFVSGDTYVYLTDGRTATQRAHDNQQANTILIDLCLDYTSAKRIALSMADQCDLTAYHHVVALFQQAGFAVSRLDDVAGMVVMRTLSMLINEAADTVNQGVCSAESVDIAMQKGVNYPLGPLAWGDRLGVDYVRRVLQHLGQLYGEDRYRISPLIQRKAASNHPFHF